MEFESFLICILIPIVYILTYIAGKYDLLALICRMLEDTWKEYEHKEHNNEEKL